MSTTTPPTTNGDQPAVAPATREGCRPDGAVVLVTGASTGIGAAIARELGSLGATVVIASRKPENVEPAAAGLTRELGREVFAEIMDIRDRDAVGAAVGRVVARHGRIDVLVNNGGGQFMAPAETIPPKGWDAVVATNLTGTWNVTRAVADAWMLAHGGRVVNITMLTHTFPGMVHSVAARSGVEAMTRTLAVEWAARGVRINAVAPGFVASSGLRRYPPALQAMMPAMVAKVPLKRFGTPEEIAWAVAYLAGPGGDYVTGQTFVIDGGKTLWGDTWPIPDPPELPGVEIPTEPWETE